VRGRQSAKKKKNHGGGGASRFWFFPVTHTATMSLQSVATRNTITLKGSAKLVTEYFAYAVNR
jgi:hypothetical protein